MKIKITDYIAQFMAEHGVTDVFTVTGGGAMHLNDAFGHSDKLKCIYNHNEQGSAIGAESYARLTGKIALCCVTSGPGGTNAITGVMGGWLDSIPMFVISGQVKRETTVWSCPELKLRALGDQEFHITDAVSCMTKYCEMITEPNDIAYHLEKAWYLANSGRKGPVWLDIPLDVQGAPVEIDELRHFCARCEGLDNPGYEDKVVITANDVRASDGESDNTDDRHFEITHVDTAAEEILKRIASAKAPLIFAGEGVRIAGAAERLLELIKKIRVPAAVAWNSGDLIAYDNPYYAGSPSREGTRGSSFIVQNCDLILVLGSRMGIRTITYNRHDFAKNAYKIMVDIDQNELDKPTFIPDMKIKGDVKSVIEAMLRVSYKPAACHEKWRQWCRAEVERYPAVMPEYHTPGLINPYVFIDKLSKKLRDDDVITLGNGSACVMTFTALKVKQGQRMYTNNGCAAMGYGMPAAMGAAAARRRETGKNDRVICIDGDGSVMMNIQELQTIAHNRLNVKLFVLDNNGYNSIRQTQTNLFHGKLVGVDPGSGVSFPDFEKLADAFGLKYFHINTEATADMILENALSTDGPALIRVQVDPSQNFVPKLSSKVLPDGRIVSPSMDDMFPFLSREEYEDNRYRG